MYKKVCFVLAILIFGVVGSHNFLSAQSRPQSSKNLVEESSGRLYWLTSRLEAPAQFIPVRDGNLVLDDNDRPHIVYGGNALYYSWFDGTSWQREIVDILNHDAGRNATLALDSTGNPHIVYLQMLGPNSSALRYAYRTRQGWIYRVISAGENIYYNSRPSFVLDSNDVPHVVYEDNSIGLNYAKWTGTQWAFETITTANTQLPTIMIDGMDNPHVLFHKDLDYNNATIEYARRQQDTWLLETIDAGYRPEIGGPSLAIDKTNQLHVMYVKEGSLMYAQQTASGWNITTVTSSQDIGGLSLAVAGSGVSHISYKNLSTNALEYAYYSEDGWSFEKVVDEIGGDYYSSLVLDRNERPWISYVSKNGYYLKYASRSTEGWSTEIIEEAGMITEQAMAIDSQDHYHLSYVYSRDVRPGIPPASATVLKYMQMVDGNLTTEMVDQDAEWPTIAMDANDRPHISYYGKANGDLKYARLVTNTWHIQTVDWPGDVGLYSSMAIDDAGDPHISYYDKSYQDLNYAHWTGSSWLAETVDHIGMISDNDISLALDSLDNPYIAYSDSEEGQLKVASLSSGNWLTETVDNGYISGVSLAIDHLDNLHVSYSTEHLVRYGRKVNGSWSVQTIGNLLNRYGYSSSLVLDSQENPHIGYQNYTHYHKILEYIYWDGNQWVKYIPDNTWSVGYHISLVLDSHDRPFIAHIDDLNGHLKFSQTASASHYLPVIR